MKYMPEPAAARGEIHKAKEGNVKKTVAIVFWYLIILSHNDLGFTSFLRTDYVPSTHRNNT